MLRSLFVAALVGLVSFSSSVLGQSSVTYDNAYGVGYPGYAAGYSGTPPNVFFCSPTFNISTTQKLQAVGVQYLNDGGYDNFNLLIGLYAVSNYTGNGIHTLVAAGNQANPLTVNSAATPGTGLNSNQINLNVANFALQPSFNGILQPGQNYASCFNTDQLNPIEYGFSGSNPQEGTDINGAEGTFLFSQGLPTTINTTDLNNGGEFTYVLTTNFSASSSSSSSSSSSTGVARSSSSTGAAVRGDPQFVGLLGQSYQVHGIDGAVYNLISDAMVQVNARFTFLDSGKCLRDAQNKPLFTCWSHPGSYLSAVAVRTVEGDWVQVEAGTAAAGFSSVTVNNNTVSVGQTIEGADKLTLTYTSLRTLTIRSAGLYTLTLENSDSFVNIARLEVSNIRTLRDSVQSHGLIGQTWRRHDLGKEVKAVEGYIDDYAEQTETLFGCSFMYNKFQC